MGKFNREVHLSREMTLMDITLIGVGAMIGAGIFVLTGIAAGVAGPALILAFLLNGLVALLTAMSYAELGSCFHDAGGGYLWVKEGLPRWNGFLSGWMSWFAHAVACSLYALGFGAYFDHVLTELGATVPHWGGLGPEKVLAVGIAVIFAFINYRGASETGKIGNMVTLAKIAILAVFVGFGFEAILRLRHPEAGLVPFLPNGWGGVFRAMGLTFIAFQGFEVISQCSEEVRNPKRNIPRAVFFSLVIVVPIYLLVAFVSLAAVHPQGMTSWQYLALEKETALVEVAKTFFSGGGVLLLVGGLISTMSALNATVYSSSRVAFAMGRDHNFPSFFGSVHAKRFTPHHAIFVSLIIIVLMSVSLPIEDVASAADIMFLLLFFQVNLTLIRLRRKRPDLDRGFRVPLFPALTYLAIGLLAFLAVFMVTYSPKGALVTAGWVGAGMLVYRFYASKRELEHAVRQKALAKLEKKEFKILVALSSPRSVEGLVRVATGIARKHDAEILLLHVIEVDEGLPLRAGLRRTERAFRFLEAGETRVEAAQVPARSLLRISHRISQGIVETAREESCNFIVLGRQQRPGFVERVFSSLIDGVLERSPCEVAVLHGDLPDGDIRRILIPFAENVHTRLALEVAPALSEMFRAEVRVVVVFEPGTPAEQRESQEKKVRDLMAANGLPEAVEVIRNGDILRDVTARSRQADLMLMGGRSSDFLGLLLGPSLTQEITEQAACPVLWLKEVEERASFWGSLFKPYGKEVEAAHE
jgi:amino acid transporter/nucleotide-binding universal stress UspA family protein